MPARRAALLGCPTSNGGKVSTASSGLNNNGPVATIGDLVFCPACQQDFPIVALRPLDKRMPNGRQIALEGDKVACRCSSQPLLLANISTMLVEG
ncbi:PAAR domain-containing protein [Neisseriaceae bacterium TC5R-5]|nr:PAAR domain-containing protein [Neisseriaceae bacterium TC5R-5]